MRNPDWNAQAFATQWAADTSELVSISLFMVEKSEQLNNPDDPYYPYAVDHANEHLAHAVKLLRETASKLTSLRQYTNYPPQPDELAAARQLFQPDRMDDDLRATIKAALGGDSNDDEHDALFAVAEAYGITYVSYEDRMMEEDLANAPTEDDAKDWLYEVANGDTRLGFTDWLSHRAESGS